jgi:hypothetical protein
MKAGLRGAAKIRRLAVVVFLLSFPVFAFAGPPYITDDREPVEYQHWEVYLASIFTKQPDAWTGTTPHVEVNYGVVPDVQLHTILPMTLYAPADGASSYGYGDTELGVKYRFVQEGTWRPQFGIFPLLEAPPDLMIEISVADICRHSCRFGSKRAEESGLHTEGAVIGSIQVLEI